MQSFNTSSRSNLVSEITECRININFQMVCIAKGNTVHKESERCDENGQHTWTSFAVLLDTLLPAPSRARQGFEKNKDPVSLPQGQLCKWPLDEVGPGNKGRVQKPRLRKMSSAPAPCLLLAVPPGSAENILPGPSYPVLNITHVVEQLVCKRPVLFYVEENVC